MTTAWWCAAVTVVAVGLLGGCSGNRGENDAAPTGNASGPAATATHDSVGPPTPSLARFYFQRLDWRDCDDGFACTKVLVPVDYAQPRGDTLKIAVNRLPASGDRAGALFVNPGGPGVSGLHYARAASTIVSKDVRQRYDVVGFDPRGVGASRPLECLSDKQLDAFIAADGTPDDAAEERALQRQGELLAAGCKADDRALMAHIGTRDAARDLDVLRAVLGDRRLTYLGKSYGTYLGATYAGLFPKRVGRLVLDGPLDPASTGLEVARGQGIGFQRALDAFLGDCLRGSGCPFSGPPDEAEQALTRLIDRIDSTPLDGVGQRRLTQSLAVTGTASALYEKELWPFLRQSLSRAVRGDGRYLMLLADSYADRGPGGTYSSNTNEVIYAINCVDRPQTGDLASYRADAAEMARTAPLFGAYIVWGNLPCATWPAPGQGEPEPITAAGSKPILVVGTTRDPATPFEWAKALSRELDAGHLLTYVGDGHTAYRRGNECVDDAVDAYLLRGEVPSAGTRCR